MTMKLPPVSSVTVQGLEVKSARRLKELLNSGEMGAAVKKDLLAKLPAEVRQQYDALWNPNDTWQSFEAQSTFMRGVADALFAGQEARLISALATSRADTLGYGAGAASPDLERLAKTMGIASETIARGGPAQPGLNPSTALAFAILSAPAKVDEITRGNELEKKAVGLERRLSPSDEMFGPMMEALVLDSIPAGARALTRLMQGHGHNAGEVNRAEAAELLAQGYDSLGGLNKVLFAHLLTRTFGASSAWASDLLRGLDSRSQRNFSSVKALWDDLPAGQQTRIRVLADAVRDAARLGLTYPDHTAAAEKTVRDSIRGGVALPINALSQTEIDAAVDYAMAIWRSMKVTPANAGPT